ncbi:hypothetical protein Aph02nite_30550 [Actinoplanes philippinensis]|uniref:AAA domain-containing protein n=1 Tax=Actinoplanes philippinensis TaxID=35752 RepID=A0A1I2EBM1_9ACTN|nr:hypothetical protein [Actinoplanes philippinensis]GIE77105.1 hypothetical protein Aph02nite_30550 [Actinoplanes philippinensis]SFE90414.1 hypothetical protein SAMN05421541_104350 [Actinoplanes philippinensis]
MRDGLWWIGGSPCAGKTTVAGRIAGRRGVPVYSCDDAFARHADGGPVLRKVTAMGVGERLAQPVEVQVDDVFALYREEFPLILDDLRDAVDGTVAEGAALLPELLAGIGVPAGRAVWIVPTVDFQVRHYRARAWAHELLAGLDRPDLAFDRWMRRDALFAERVARQARDLGYRVIVADGGPITPWPGESTLARGDGETS